MNRCVIEVVNGAPVGVVTKKDKTTYTIEGLDLLKFLGRIDEAFFGRKSRVNPIYKRMELGNTLIYLNKVQKWNVRIPEESFGALSRLFIENKKVINKEVKPYRLPQRLAVASASVLTTVMIGGLALSALSNTAQQKVDLEHTATYDEDYIRSINTNNLLAINNGVGQLDQLEEYMKTPEEELDSSLEEYSLSDEEIESVITNNNIVETNVEAVYDKGIEDRLEPYRDAINERANRWGISPELMTDIISQEYGGEGTNLTHVVFDSWKDQIITAHNFETGKDTKIVLTDTPEKYEGKVDQTISREELKNIPTNISVGAIILQYSINSFKQNIPLGMQAYNNGRTGVLNILNETSKNTGISVEQLIEDKDGLEWLNYTDVVLYGDKNYFINVIKHTNLEEFNNKVNSPYSIEYTDGDEEKEETIQFSLK